LRKVGEEQKKREEESKKLEEERKKIEEEEKKRKEEERKQEEVERQRKNEERKREEEERQRRDEEERQRREEEKLRIESERKRIEEEKKRMEEIQLQLKEKERIAEEIGKNAEERAKKAAEEEKKIEAAKRQMEEDKKKAEEEQRKKAEAEKKKAEEEKKKAEEEKKKAEEEKRKAEEEKRKADEVAEAKQQQLNCSICDEFFFEPVTLDCKHSFCNQCILNWLQDHEDCPRCRNAVRSLVRTLDLDAIVEAFMGAEAKKEREDKIKESKRREENETGMMRQMQQGIHQKRNQGQVFLQINQVWSPEQRKYFATGMSQLPLTCRQVYADCSGLNPLYLHNANLDQLRLAANNVGLKYDLATKQVDLQIRLFQYLAYGCKKYLN